MTVTVNPIPEIEAISEQVCSGDQLTVTQQNGGGINSLDIVPNGTQYIWLIKADNANITGQSAESNPQNNISQTLRNISTSAQSITYTVTPVISSTSCNGESFDLTVTVNPTPDINNISEQVCSGDQFTVTPVNGGGINSTDIVPANTTYTWTIKSDNPNITGQLAETNPQNEISQTLTNTTNKQQSIVYSVTPTSGATGSCAGIPFEITVTVNPKPEIEAISEQVCSGDEFTVTPANGGGMNSTDIVPASTTYTWIIKTDNSNITGQLAETNPQNSISQTLRNTTIVEQVIVYLVTPTSGSCAGVPFELKVTVNPSPKIDDVSQQICSEGSFTVTPVNGEGINSSDIVPAGTKYTWRIKNDNANIIGQLAETNPQNEITQTLTNTTNEQQSIVYSVTPTSSAAGSCVGIPFEITVTVNPKPEIEAISEQMCSGDELTVTPLNGGGINSLDIIPNGTQYTWVVKSDNPNITGQLAETNPQDEITQTLTNTTNEQQSILYSVTPTSGAAGSCAGIPFEITVTVNPKPEIEAISEQVCSGDELTVTPVNGGGMNSTNIVPANTTYTWTVVDNPNVDGQSDEILIPQPEISQTLTNTTNNIEDVIYTVTPVTSNGCQGESFTISVTVNPEIQDNAIITNISCSYSNPICAGSIEVNPIGIGPFTFYWSSNNGNLSRPENQNQFNLCPGDYSLEITDSSGCTQSFNYTITPPEPIEINLISLVDMSCNNIGSNCDGYIEVDIQGGTSPYIQREFYTESNPGSGQFDLLVETNSNILNNACEGNYLFKVLDTNGCEFISSIYTVKETASPINVTENISNYNGYEISCLGANDGFIDVSLSGGSGSFSYNLSPGGILDNDLSTPDVLEFKNLKVGKYTLTITDDNCPNNITLEYDLKEPSQLTSSSSLGSGPALCYGDTETYNITATGGTPPYIGTGNYTFPTGIHSIVVTDANGCQTTEIITVIEPTELTATAAVTSPILCNGEMGEVTVTGSGGTPPYQGTGIFSVMSGDFIFTVIDANGCTYSNNIFVNEPAALSFTVDNIENPTCSQDWSYSNGSICITITGGTDPFPIGAGWTSLGGGVWCLNGLPAGVHKIDIDDINNCSTNIDSKEIVLTRPPIIDAYITSSLTEDCDNNAIIQTNYIFVSGGSPPYQISWSDGNVCNPLNPQCMETTESGTYIAYIHDQESLTNGCPPIEVEVIVDLPIIGDAMFSYESANYNYCSVLSIDEPIAFKNESTGDIVSITWDFGDGSSKIMDTNSPIHVYNTIGTYQVDLIVEYAYGCRETYSETINVTKGYDIILPNAFTPNADGINDTIRPVYTCMQQISMAIYDTWGTLLYTEESNGILNGWNGTIKGVPSENGNYIIVIEATSFKGVRVSLNGPITLIK